MIVLAVPQEAEVRQVAASSESSVFVAAAIAAAAAVAWVVEIELVAAVEQPA